MENTIQNHYQVVAAVITDKDRILCLQKGKNRHAYISYKYEFPGGKIEMGETPEQALERELMEELDLKVEIGFPLVCVDHTYPDFRITLRTYLCRARQKNFRLKEHISHCWLPADQLSQLDWAEADKSIVEAVIRFFSRNQPHSFSQTDTVKPQRHFV